MLRLNSRDIIITGLRVYRTYNRSAAINLSHFNILERLMYGQSGPDVWTRDLVRSGAKNRVGQFPRRSRSPRHTEEFNAAASRAHAYEYAMLVITYTAAYWKILPYPLSLLL